MRGKEEGIEGEREGNWRIERREEEGRLGAEGVCERKRG